MVGSARGTFVPDLPQADRRRPTSAIMRSRPTSRSPSSRRISRTPWVLRPCSEISSTGGPHQRADRTDQHHFVVGIDLDSADHAAVALGGLDRNHALAAAALHRELRRGGALAETVLGGGQHVAVAHDQQGHDLVPIAPGEYRAPRQPCDPSAARRSRGNGWPCRNSSTA